MSPDEKGALLHKSKKLTPKLRSKISLGIVVYLVSGLIIWLFLTAFLPGLRYLTWDFLTKFPTGGMTEGGIFPALVGSVLITALALVISVPLGIFLGVVLSEYNLPQIKFAVTVLSGIPSVVFGLFGLALFSIAMGMRTSILAGALTLSLMVLPVISSAVYETIRAVPRELREAAYALGARKTEVIFEMLIPAVKRSLLTVAFVSAGRAIGETAPLILTAAAFYVTELPRNLFSPVMTLPTHIYFLAAAYGSKARWMAEGTASVLVLFVILTFTIAFTFRRES